MDRWKQQLTACWDSVAVQLPQLQSSLSHLGQSIGLFGGAGGGAATAAAGQEFELSARRLRVVRQLGEGGYSFVYLVREVEAAGGGGLLPTGAQVYALKRVLCGGPQQLAEAEQEVAAHRRMRHPCLLPLLDAGVQQQRTPDGSTRQVVLMLFPVYAEGNLFDFVQQQRQQLQQRLGPAGAAHQQQLQQLRRQQLRELLQLFLQVCAALHSMHSMEPALAHRDLKPQNVLLRLSQQPGSAGTEDHQHQKQQQQQQQSGSRPRAGGSIRVAPLEQEGGEGKEQQQHKEWVAEDWQSDGSTTTASAAVIAVEEEGQQRPPRAEQQGQQWWEQGLARWRQRYDAVLMDFGSTRPALVQVRNRSEAMAAQEDAERQCTAPYRAPELWDVPSSCTLDECVDVWSLGCLLYFLVCGQSPFERAAGEAGGSLMLAVVNGRLSWPEDAASSCPASVKQLVAACLDTDPAARPRVVEVAARADAILSGQLA